MAFYCLGIWILAACWIVFFHCQTTFGFNSSAFEFANISIKGDAAIAETDSDFICATLDWWPPEKCDYGTCSWGNASILNLDLESSLLENAVKAFGSFKIRLGGSLEDRVIYDVGDLKQPCHPFVKNDSLAFNFTDGCLPMSRWDALNLFFRKTRAVVAFGLNAVNGRKEISKGVWEGPWDATNAHDFIQYTVDHGYEIKAWELGNELSGKRISNATQYAADAMNLYGILKKIYKDLQVKPLLVAPDGKFNETWYTEFLQQSGPNIVDVVTHHIYSLGPGVDEHLVEKILDPSYLSQEESVFKSLKIILENYGPWSRAWVGEAGGAYNSGHNLVTNAFVSSFWYLDQLGMASTYNTKTYCRQTLIGGNYGFLNTTTYVPNPDYYSALLWHQLMGERVLSINSSGTQYLRTYAHCTKNATGVTLLLINLGKSDGVTVEGSIYSQNGGKMNPTTRTDLVNGKSRLEYHLTAKDGDLHSQTMLLNGKILDVSPKGEIPSLEPVEVNSQTSISVAPLSIAYVSLPYVELPACSR